MKKEKFFKNLVRINKSNLLYCYSTDCFYYDLGGAISKVKNDAKYRNRFKNILCYL